ncbi:hypothetical protein EHS25_002398 [Saitozyma podzolica]|uniref:Uncharacterized protein n=1 Tax=Saitozyma podzolica TaxID=1890683 RepID=A0A427YDX4_9TREE|nr:hypothetical protein EHS25_002398 [Saitozyma podzolica]
MISSAQAVNFTGRQLAHLCRQNPGLSSTLATKPIAQTPAMAPSLKTYNPQWTESALRNKITRAAAAAAAPKCSLSRR